MANDDKNKKSIPVTEQSKDDIEEARANIGKGSDPDDKKFLNFPEKMASILAKGAANMQNAYGDQWSPKSSPPKLHKGGVVKQDGLHDLKKGETVRTKEQEKEMQDKMEKAKPKAMMTSEEPKKESGGHEKEGKKKHKFHHTVIEHHTDGKSHTVRHVPAPSADGKPGEEMSYASPDMAGVHAGLDANVGGAEPAQAAPVAQAAPAAAMPQQV